MTQKSKLPGILNTLCHKAGSRTALAKELGVTESTIYRWAHNRMAISSSTQKLLEILCHKYNINPKIYIHKKAPDKIIVSYYKGWQLFKKEKSHWVQFSKYSSELSELSEINSDEIIKQLEL